MDNLKNVISTKSAVKDMKSNSRKMEKENLLMEKKLSDLKEKLKGEMDARKQSGGPRWRSSQMSSAHNKKNDFKSIKVLRDVPLEEYLQKKQNKSASTKSDHSQYKEQIMVTANRRQRNANTTSSGNEQPGNSPNKKIITQATFTNSNIAYEPTPPTREKENMRGNPNSLLYGVYDEKESAQSFKEALNEWRKSGSSTTETKPPTKCDKNEVSVSVQSPAVNLESDISSQIRFDSSLSYMEKLMVRKYRQNDQLFQERPGFSLIPTNLQGDYQRFYSQPTFEGKHHPGKTDHLVAPDINNKYNNNSKQPENTPNANYLLAQDTNIGNQCNIDSEQPRNNTNNNYLLATDTKYDNRFNIGTDQPQIISSTENLLAADSKNALPYNFASNKAGGNVSTIENLLARDTKNDNRYNNSSDQPGYTINTKHSIALDSKKVGFNMGGNISNTENLLATNTKYGNQYNTNKGDPGSISNTNHLLAPDTNYNNLNTYNSDKPRNISNTENLLAQDSNYARPYSISSEKSGNVLSTKNLLATNSNYGDRYNIDSGQPRNISNTKNMFATDTEDDSRYNINHGRSGNISTTENFLAQGAEYATTYVGSDQPGNISATKYLIAQGSNHNNLYNYKSDQHENISTTNYLLAQDNRRDNLYNDNSDQHGNISTTKYMLAQDAKYGNLYSSGNPGNVSGVPLNSARPWSRSNIIKQNYVGMGNYFQLGIDQSSGECKEEDDTSSVSDKEKDDASSVNDDQSESSYTSDDSYKFIKTL